MRIKRSQTSQTTSQASKTFFQLLQIKRLQLKLGTLTVGQVLTCELNHLEQQLKSVNNVLLFAHAFSLCASHFVSCTVEVPFWPPCFYWFFGSCFAENMARVHCHGPFIAAMFLTTFLGPVLGAMMSRFVGIRGAPRLTEACPRHADKARLTGTRIYNPIVGVS